MKHTNVQVAYYLIKSKLNSEKKVAPVYIRIKYKGRQINLSTEIWLNPKSWDGKKARMKNLAGVNNSSEVAATNKHLTELQDRVFEIANDLKHAGMEITLEAIKVKLQKKETGLTLLALFDQHIKGLEANLNNGYVKGTISHYKNCKNKLQDFLKTDVYNVKDISLERLDFNFINQFQNYLSSFCKNKVNSQQKTIKKLRCVINQAVKLSYLKENPFRNYKAKSEPTNRQYLTYEEVQRIEKLDLAGNTKLEEVRDMFLFYVYTSISYSDAKSLTKENIQLSISGKKFIIYQRNKTGVSATVPMLDTTEKLLNKFSKNPAVIYSGKLIYQYTNQHINRCLTDIAKLAEINKPLTCHVGRHTHAVLSLERGKVPMETVSKVMGHISIKTTQIYGRITNRKVESDYADMNDIFSKSDVVSNRLDQVG